MTTNKFKRVLLKLSGESLEGNLGYGIDPDRLMEYAQQVHHAHCTGVQIGIVIGGGNIFRGLSGTQKGFDRVTGDQMGMLATVINSLSLYNALTSLGSKTKLFTAVGIESVGERFSKPAVLEAMGAGYICIFSGGTGNPFFSTDTAAALRAVETDCDLLLKGTRVDGVYTADPEKDPTAIKYQYLTYKEAYEKGLKIMDLTAFTLCRENNMKLMVFDMNTPGNLMKIVSGENIGTLVSN
ncbi:MAG TPA: UMP kinase [Bacteroidales bacterium]|nr:UMP kinase [Bacteroidales bacterium]HOE05094.1 UMP kinase [Bacteroidales bacterium]HQL69588.1 UMP kinase [Bacteroidales bacterium]